MNHLIENQQVQNQIRFYSEALVAGLTKSVNQDKDKAATDELNTDAVKFLAKHSFTDKLAIGEKVTNGPLVTCLVQVIDSTPNKTDKNSKIGKVRKYLARFLEAELGESPDRRIGVKTTGKGISLEIIAKTSEKPSLIDQVRALVQEHGFEDVEKAIATLKLEAEQKVAA